MQCICQHECQHKIQAPVALLSRPNNARKFCSLGSPEAYQLAVINRSWPKILERMSNLLETENGGCDRQFAACQNRRSLGRTIVTSTLRGPERKHELSAGVLVPGLVPDWHFWSPHVSLCL